MIYSYNLEKISPEGQSCFSLFQIFTSSCFPSKEVTCGRISFSIQTNDLKRVGSIRSSKRNRATSPPEVAENRLSSAALSEEDLSDKPVTEDQAAGTTYRYFDFCYDITCSN